MNLNRGEIRTTLRESMLFEAGSLAGEAKALKETAARVRQLAGEMQAVDFEPFQKSLAELAGFLTDTVAPAVKGAKLRSAIVNGVQLLPANGKGVVDFTKQAAVKLTALSGALEAEAAAKSDAFAKQVAETGELAPPPEPRRRGFLARVIRRVAAQL